MSYSSLIVYCGKDKTGSARRRLLAAEAKRRGLSVSELVWRLIYNGSDPVLRRAFDDVSRNGADDESKRTD